MPWPLVLFSIMNARPWNRWDSPPVLHQKKSRILFLGGGGKGFWSSHHRWKVKFSIWFHRHPVKNLKQNVFFSASFRGPNTFSRDYDGLFQCFDRLVLSSWIFLRFFLLHKQLFGAGMWSLPLVLRSRTQSSKKSGDPNGADGTWWTTWEAFDFAKVIEALDSGYALTSW